ncbi:dynamin family protein [Thermostichus vulcanus]|uniref:Dynamin family protein n=1 Tax=Thermostichus vulcanus str. 'Rupite' TaxID=2813851 RepID=A0ABT0CD26_THEVL|nr:dynamin family protein [Thermostichus vulcanus]MCJ2543697.1 dynamin family protein [Thermostichus vulcanus str. 'Rupite']
MHPSQVLQTSRELLFQLGNAVKGIPNEYQDTIGDPLILEKLEKFRVDYEEAVARLENPSFRIATIGTTSSGKSTIVNALIGRQIAPIEAQEMSAGILRVKHSEETKLVIHETEGSTWETGMWEGLSDQEIYSKVEHVMGAYHQERKKKKNNVEAMVPEVDVYCPILPVRDPSLLNLPKEVGVEIYDLPGLKSIQDRSNLRVIQEQVSKCFSIVSLDYTQVDDQHRASLLKELKNVVEYLGGRTDQILFLLNRVDLRTQQDKPLEERIEELQREIQNVLELPDQPHVVPLSALMLFYAQCAWGANSFQSSDVDPGVRKRMLDSLFKDCAKLIKTSTSGDRILRSWLHDLEQDIEEGLDISDEDVKKVLMYALDWSGGGTLWNALRERVRSAFPAAVITPALFQVVNTAKDFVASMDIVIEARRIETIEEVDRQQRYIQQRQESCKAEAEKLVAKFVDDISDLEEQISKSDGSPEDNLKIEKKAKEKGWTGFPAFSDFLEDRAKDLTLQVILPIRGALRGEIGIYELEDSLSKVVPGHLANRVARCCDLAIRVFSDFERGADNFTIRIETEASDGQKHKKIENAEFVTRALYQSVRQALTCRAEFLLQAKAKTFVSFGNSLISQLVEGLINIYKDSPDSLSISQAIVNDIKVYTESHPLTLPEDEVFVFPDPLTVEEETEPIKTKKNQTKILLGRGRL